MPISWRTSARSRAQIVDPGVRSAALKRLADPAFAQRVAHDDTDPGVRAEARALWFDLLAGNASPSRLRRANATDCCARRTMPR